MNKLRILNIEDDSAYAELFKIDLGNFNDAEFEVVNKDQLRSGIDELNSNREEYDVVVADLGLPDSHDIETLRRVLPHAADLPVIVFTGSDNFELGKQCIREGAQEFIPKDLITSGLIPKIIVHSIERKHIERELKTTIREKEILLAEVNHRVKNNLLLLISLVSLEIDTTEDKNVIEVLQKTKERLFSISLIYNHLYESNNFNEIDLKDCLMQLTHVSKQGLDDDTNVIFEVQAIGDCKMSLHKSVPFMMFINELISNSISHLADDKKSFIQILMHREGNQLQLNFHDDCEKISDDIFAKNLTNLSSRLIRIFAKQLLAETNFSYEEGNKFDISIPLDAFH